MANPPRDYDKAMLDALERALRDVLQVLAAHDPDIDCDDTVVKMALSEKLNCLADAGIRDPHELRNRTLQSLSLGRFH